ncbi:hypothetical protein ACFL3V_02805 [Nanoarchaeota archaeon]
MGLFSKKEDTRYIKEFDTALQGINAISTQFREAHFQSLEMFQKNFEKEKTSEEFEKERLLFERHMDMLKQLKLNTDIMVEEAFKIVRNETALTEKDRKQLHSIMEPREKTNIQMQKGK